MKKLIHGDKAGIILLDVLEVKMQQDQNPDESIDDMDQMDEDLAIARSRKKKHLGNKVKPPHKYAVILQNDDYTPMEFVVFVLIEIFHHPPERAERIMLSVHKDGMGVAGIYHLEIAEEKAYETAVEAKEHQYPLNIKVEKVG
jgi:ATP-dependent Clp protease adaptor protein ClpS